MGNYGIYSVCKYMVKQNITFCQKESFAGPSLVGLTRETLAKSTVWRDSSSSSHVLYTWLFSRVSFSWDSREPIAKSICTFLEAWVFTDLSHSSFTINPTYIQGKWLKKLIMLGWSVDWNCLRHCQRLLPSPEIKDKSKATGGGRPKILRW